MQTENILYIDDEIENLRTLQRVLAGRYQVTTFTDPQSALNACKEESFGIILADQRMPQITGVEFLKKILPMREISLGIIVTAYSDQDALIDGINHGLIFRYITKPIKEAELIGAIAQAQEHLRIKKENHDLVTQLKNYNAYLEKEVSQVSLGTLESPKYKGLEEVTKLIAKVAPTQSTVLIRGESGSGKEVAARMIHQLSARKTGPFIRVNCGSITESILESELFGHEKGAFTGAVSQHIGKIESAHAGTIFLDEIGDISPKLQISLLRVLQEKQLERVGGKKTIDVDVRFLAATHQPLEKMIATKHFREDLFYRLNVFPITIPPLRHRMGDLQTLLPVLLEKVSRRCGMPAKTISADAVQLISSYDWPGNVRELENILERALILSSEKEIQPEDILIPEIAQNTFEPENSAKELTLEQIQAALAETDGNKVEAARRLGIKRPTLYYHLRRFGIT